MKFLPLRSPPAMRNFSSMRGTWRRCQTSNERGLDVLLLLAAESSQLDSPSSALTRCRNTTISSEIFTGRRISVQSFTQKRACWHRHNTLRISTGLKRMSTYIGFANQEITEKVAPVLHATKLFAARALKTCTTHRISGLNI